MKAVTNQLIVILAKQQSMHCYNGDQLLATYRISTGKNGLGEQSGSERTPRGWHSIHNIIGLEQALNSVCVAREWTGVLYTSELGTKFPERDWILTRIIQLDGLEPGRNKGGDVDSLQRYIYIHGTAHEDQLGMPASHGCIRMANADITLLADWVEIGARVFIE